VQTEVPIKSLPGPPSSALPLNVKIVVPAIAAQDVARGEVATGLVEVALVRPLPS
jgi:hypothetical protein